MKAIAVNEFVKDISDLQVSNISPPKPKAGEVLVNVTHSAINHVDLLYARGLHQNNHSGLVKPPFILGLEFSGIVADVSSLSDSLFQQGDHVWGATVGCFAEQIAVPATQLRKLPRGWSLSDAAGVGAATAPVSYGALARVANVQKGQIVLVHAAAGGLGVAAVQIAIALGAKVIGTVGSAEKAEVVRKLGVLGVIRYDREGWEGEVKKLTAGQGVDVVYDTVGLVEKSIRCLRYGGTIIVAGFAGLEGKMEKLAMNRILLKGVKVIGYRYGETGRRDPAENEVVWKGLDDLIARGSVRPVIYRTFKGLESVPDALKELAARKVYGKAVVEVQVEAKPTARL